MVYGLSAKPGDLVCGFAVVFHYSRSEGAMRNRLAAMAPRPKNLGIDEVTMPFDMIAFDADDTLWHSESYYYDTQDAYVNLLAPYGVERQAALDILRRIEIENLAYFGYGLKGFTLSMVEAAVEASAERVRAADIRAIIELGRAMSRHEVRLLEHGAETVAHLAQTHRLMVITKGDLMDQERKIADSGLAKYFQQVEIVSDKTPHIYEALLRKHGVAPERFLMIGNSMRSDILPVLGLGGWAVYVPYALSWAHEAGEAPSDVDGRFYEIEHLGRLPELVTEMELKMRAG